MDEPIIAICTDFGTRDGYAGALKGVILSICPTARCVDITHDITPGDVREAAYVLDSCCGYFPAGTVFLVVVDPGVGSSRRALAVRSGGRFFIGPDNGVFGFLLSAADGVACHELTSPDHRLKRVSATFHGRDIFAPAAAHLAAGVDLEELGPPVADPVCLDAETPRFLKDGSLAGRVVHVDRFGNIVTDIGREMLAVPGRELSKLSVELAGQRIDGIATHYAEATPGGLLALIGSHGRLEIAANRASAADLLGSGLRDSPVKVFGLGPKA